MRDVVWVLDWIGGGIWDGNRVGDGFSSAGSGDGETFTLEIEENSILKEEFRFIVVVLVDWIVDFIVEVGMISVGEISMAAVEEISMAPVNKTSSRMVEGTGEDVSDSLKKILNSFHFIFYFSLSPRKLTNFTKTRERTTWIVNHLSTRLGIILNLYFYLQSSCISNCFFSFSGMQSPFPRMSTVFIFGNTLGR